jgi:hypothetical protein
MKRRRVSRRQTPASHYSSPGPTTFRTVATDGEPVHAVQYIAAWLMAPCGARTSPAYREDFDPRCPEEATCPACLAWLAAQPKQGEG